jgi:hypothetical protein
MSFVPRRRERLEQSSLSENVLTRMGVTHSRRTEALFRLRTRTADPQVGRRNSDESREAQRALCAIYSVSTTMRGPVLNLILWLGR